MVASVKRREAIERAKTYSPFLRDTAGRFPGVVSAYLEKGENPAISAALAIETADVGTELRRQRTALALAVALGDLSGDLDLETVTRALSDYADDAIDRALATAFAERVPDAD